MSKAICTILNDNFTDGGIVMLSSFLKHNTFDGDIIVITNERYSRLWDHNRKKLQDRLKRDIIFHDANEYEYQDLINHFILKTNGKMVHLIPSVFTFEVFDFCTKYDQVLYLDADMLIRGNIMELFDLKQNGVYVTPALTIYEPTILSGEFNGGFLFINKMGFNNMKKELIDTGLSMNTLTLLDQPIMNEYFQDKVIYLSLNYNCGKRAFPDTNMGRFNKDIKIIHYVGAKPWNEKFGFELNYSKLEELWFNELKSTIY
jgi:lipopolysaccharide biosynthesis glycosyltransferase